MTQKPAQLLTLTSPRTPHPGRRCTTPNCQRPPRRRGRLCASCNTHAWRARHRPHLKAREQERYQARTFTDDEKALRWARGYLSTYLRKGAIQRDPCQVCHAQRVVPHFPDLTTPLAVVWLCRSHRIIELQRLAQAKADAQTLALQVAKHTQWRSDRERFASEFPRLSPELQETLRAQAQAALLVDPRLRHLPLNPQAPLVQQSLIRTYIHWADTHD